MTYFELPPCDQLKQYIQCYWVLEFGSSNQASPERILPDGSTELLFHFGDLYQQLVNGKKQTQPRSFLYGQLQHFIEVLPTGTTGIVAVRFKPHGFSAFTTLHANELTHNKIPITDLFGEKGNVLEDQLYNTTSNQDRLAILRTFLLQHLRPTSQHHLLINHAIELMHQSSGQIPIQSIAEDCNIGYKALERLYQAKVGLSPKQHARIVRFQGLFKHYASGTVTNLTELAYAAGYYDQAHFIRDFKHFSGLAPGQYFSETNALSDLLTLPKNTV